MDDPTCIQPSLHPAVPASSRPCIHPSIHQSILHARMHAYVHLSICVFVGPSIRPSRQTDLPDTWRSHARCRRFSRTLANSLHDQCDSPVRWRCGHVCTQARTPRVSLAPAMFRKAVVLCRWLNGHFGGRLWTRTQSTWFDGMPASLAMHQASHTRCWPAPLEVAASAAVGGCTVCVDRAPAVHTCMSISMTRLHAQLYVHARRRALVDGIVRRAAGLGLMQDWHSISKKKSCRSWVLVSGVGVYVCTTHISDVYMQHIGSITHRTQASTSQNCGKIVTTKSVNAVDTEFWFTIPSRRLHQPPCGPSTLQGNT